MQNMKNRANTEGAVVRIVIWSVVLLILAGIFAMCFVTQLWGDGFGLISFGSSSYWYDQDDSYQIGNAVVADEVRHLDIDWLDGKLEIVIGEGDTVTLSEKDMSNSDKSIDKDDSLRWRVVDGCLEVKYCKPYFFWGVGNKMPEKQLVLELPASAADTLFGNVKIMSTAADVQMDAISVKTLDIETVDGTLTFEGMTVDEMDIEGVNMTLNISNCSVEDFDLDGVAVTMTYQGKLKNADLDGVDYQITFTLADTTRNLDIDTVEGDVTFCLPEDISGFKVSADGLDCHVTSQGFEGVSYGKDTCTYGDQSMVVTVDGVGCQLKIEKLTNN